MAADSLRYDAITTGIENDFLSEFSIQSFFLLGQYFLRHGQYSIGLVPGIRS
jgi:hypothetical protein